ncbi:AAA family ATPase [Mycoplasmatota bacterium zrk1]
MIDVRKLKNAYGIRKINFNIGDNNDKNLLIYAPNGTFKTSFAKTLKKLTDGEKPEDLVFNDLTEYEVHLENRIFTQNEVKEFHQIVFYYEDLNKSRTISGSDFSVLVANDEAKSKYMSKMKEYSLSLQSVVDSISLMFFTKSKADKERLTLLILSEAFSTDDDWESVISKISKEDFTKLDFSYKYKDIFGEGVYPIISEDSFVDAAGNYLDTVSKKTSSILFKGQFGPQEAENVAKALKDNYFWEEGLSINLRNDEKVSSKEDFDRLIKQEIEKLFDDPEIKDSYDNMNIQLNRNAATRKLSQIIRKDLNLLHNLRNPGDFKRKVILSMMYDLSDKIMDLSVLIQNIKSELFSIKNEYKRNRLIWDEILDEFNQRFEFPLGIEIVNRASAVVGVEVPQFKFTYVDGARTAEVKEDQLNEFLSMGEKNVFSILSFLLELKLKSSSLSKTIVVVDDIVDSFDYKNKYATISYLNELAKDDYLQVIVMTHNFDFYRSLTHSNFERYVALSIDGKVTLESFFDYKSVTTIRNWRRKYKKENEKTIIYYSLIPFARSLEELRNGQTQSFKILTKALHYKTDFSEGKFKRILKPMKKNIGFRAWKLYNKKVYNSLFSTCETIALNSNRRKAEKKLLQDKLVISIGIRVLFEKKLIEKYSIDNDFLKSINANQTRAIIEHVGANLEDDDVSIANKVTVYTPEFIHINSFMVEPIIDLSIENLVTLYHEVKGIS